MKIDWWFLINSINWLKSNDCFLKSSLNYLKRKAAYFLTKDAILDRTTYFFLFYWILDCVRMDWKGCCYPLTPFFFFMGLLLVRSIEVLSILYPCLSLCNCLSLCSLSTTLLIYPFKWVLIEAPWTELIRIMSLLSSSP